MKTKHIHTSHHCKRVTAKSTPAEVQEAVNAILGNDNRIEQAAKREVDFSLYEKGQLTF